MKKRHIISSLCKTSLHKKAIGTLLLMFIVPLVSAQQYADKTLQLKAIDYKLDIYIDYANNKLQSTCELTVRNTSSVKTQIIPLLLYRLMKVSTIKDEKGNTMPNTQRIVSFEDWEKIPGKLYRSDT